ncbi:hypothetical protein EOL96_07875 [Candidatus Saccharibacteria bacterium]|nr:hypothetical protein [Candidatus Saccharibacteria bacterium]
MQRRDNIKDSLPTFKEYLKLLESTPVILEKMHDMEAMDKLLRIFFSNFTITPIKDGTFKGSTVTGKLNEPWNGFVESNDFVLGAPFSTR